MIIILYGTSRTGVRFLGLRASESRRDDSLEQWWTGERRSGKYPRIFQVNDYNTTIIINHYSDTYIMNIWIVYIH
jgi:hypothetical protein